MPILLRGAPKEAGSPANAWSGSPSFLTAQMPGDPCHGSCPLPLGTRVGLS